MEFLNGVANVTLIQGKSLTISDIPVGTLYLIEEINIPCGYKSKTTSPTSSTIEKNTTSMVEWENSIVVHETVYSMLQKR